MTTQSSFLPGAAGTTPASSTPASSGPKKPRGKATRETATRPEHKPEPRPPATERKGPTYYRVRDLIRTLAKLPQDALVVLSSDPEGNQFSPLGSFSMDMGKLEEEKGRDGQVYRALFEPGREGSEKRADAITLYPTS